MTQPVLGETAQRFERFHFDNPRVFEVLESLVEEWVARFGITPLGIRMLWERARWELIVETATADYKLNNNYTGYYARLLIWHHPEWRDLFELRRSPADRWVAERTAGIPREERS